MHEANESQHYSTIRNFSRLVYGQLSNYQHTIYSCKKCLHACSSADVLKRHMERCTHVQLAKFPIEPRCRFTNIQKQLPAPFVVYADFESVLKPLSDMDTMQGIEEGEEPSGPYQEHVACSFSYKIISSLLSGTEEKMLQMNLCVCFSVKQKNFVQSILKHPRCR